MVDDEWLTASGQRAKTKPFGAATSDQPSAISHQPSAISRLP